LFGKIKEFLVLFKIFMGIFVNGIIKDFCPHGIFSKFLPWIFGEFLGIVIKLGFCGFFGHSCTVPL